MAPPKSSRPRFGKSHKRNRKVHYSAIDMEIDIESEDDDFDMNKLISDQPFTVQPKTLKRNSKYFKEK